MKTIKCDLCDLLVDIGATKPHGWGYIKIDQRSGSNIGGQVIKLDMCPKCTEGVRLIGGRDEAAQFIKSIASEK